MREHKFIAHEGNLQPKATKRKRVLYKLTNSPRMGVALADDINWNTSSPGAPTEYSRIAEYVVL